MLQCYSVTVIQCYCVTVLLCYCVRVLECYRVVGSQSEGNNPENGDATATDTVPGPAHLVYHLICQFVSKKLPILGTIRFFLFFIGPR